MGLGILRVESGYGIGYSEGLGILSICVIGQDFELGILGLGILRLNVT